MGDVLCYANWSKADSSNFCQVRVFGIHRYDESIPIANDKFNHIDSLRKAAERENIQRLEQMLTNAFSCKVLIPENVLSQEIQDEVVLLNLENESYYSLNLVGSRMWQLLIEKENVETAVQQLLKLFVVDETTLRRDVKNLLDELVREGLLSVSEL